MREVATHGPGYHLKRMLRWFRTTPHCQCNEHAKQMDQWGPDRCERRIEVIIDWIVDAAAARCLPAPRVAVRLIVMRAIKQSRDRLNAL